jgi:hypothetical protein
VAVGRNFGISAFRHPGNQREKTLIFATRKILVPKTPMRSVVELEESRKDLDRPSKETRGEQSKFRKSSEILWTIGSKSSRIVDLLHESPYRDSRIGVTRVLESLHRELPILETLKRSEPLDPRHRESLDLE